jgi:hypothetical protein
MKNTNKLILSAIVLLLSTGVALSSASASGHATTEAAGEVVDSTKEKAICVAKEQADKAVDTGIKKATETLDPTDAVKKAVE